MKKYLAPVALVCLAGLLATAQAQFPTQSPQLPKAPADPAGFPDIAPARDSGSPAPVLVNPAGNAKAAGLPLLPGRAATTAAPKAAAPTVELPTVDIQGSAALPDTTKAAAKANNLNSVRATPADRAPVETREPSLPGTATLPTIPGVVLPSAPAGVGVAKGAPGIPASAVFDDPTLATAPGAGPFCATPSCAPHNHLHLLFSADYLLWSVHGADVPYAQSFNGINPATAVPAGQVSTVAPSYTSGFRLGTGVGLSDCSWIVANITYFRSFDSSAAVAASPDVLHSLLAFPNTANAAADSLAANATYNITLLTADFAYKQAFINNEALTLSWLAGARYAHLDQRLTALYQITGATGVGSQVNFNGGGPRMGLDGQYRIAGGFYGYGNGFANLIAGQFTGQAFQQNVFAGVQGATTVNENRIVPVLELELGFGWMSPNGRIRFSGGYYVGSWFNAMTISTLQSAIQGGNFTTNGNNLRDNIVFDGFVGRIELRY